MNNSQLYQGNIIRVLTFLLLQKLKFNIKCSGFEMIKCNITFCFLKNVKPMSWNFIWKWLSICLHHGEGLKVKMCKSNTWDCSDFSCWTNLNVKYYIPHQQRWRSTVSNNLNIRNNIITNAKREISKLNIELFVVNITTEWQMLWLSMVVSHQCSRVTPLLTIDIIEN